MTNGNNKEEKLKYPFSYNVIYIYEVPYKDHQGALKIGKTSFYSDIEIKGNEKQAIEMLEKAARKRISEQTTTGAFQYYLRHCEVSIKRVIKKGKIEWESFLDDDVHEVLLNSGIKRAPFAHLEKEPREWFKVTLQTAINAIQAVKQGRKSLNNDEIDRKVKKITLYPNQEDAVLKTLKNFKSSNSMLWDAKMRFGKTVTALELVKRLNTMPEVYGPIKKVIIATHRPEVIEQWYEDFKNIFYEDNSTWKFGSKVKGYGLPVEDLVKCNNIVCFASLQDLRGAKQAGGKFVKNAELYNTKWDLLIIDEAHEGTLTERGENVFKELIDESQEHKTKVLRLSGTPFNIIDQYDQQKEVYTWNYVDEQEAKSNWDYFKDPINPYAKMPTMNVYTYDLGTIINNPHYLDDKMFNFGEFFRVWTGNRDEDIADDGTLVSVPQEKIGKFVHEKDIKSFLNLLTTEDEGSNYPYSTKEYQNYFKHSLWMVPGVKEAAALSKLLKEHPVFKYFGIVNVAGDGDEIEENNEEALRKTKRALDKVKEAIKSNERTITLSCQRLTTGVTVPEWTAVFMLYGSSQVAAQRYMQTIFRVQSPANFGGRIKENCFVFEFAPDRALKVLAKTANLKHQAGKVNSKETNDVMEHFLKFCPVIAINGSQMNKYDVPAMIKQLKSAYIDDIVDSGFENKRIYNLEQLKLGNINVKDFEGCSEIIKGASLNKTTKLVKIVENDLDKKEESKKTISDRQPKSEEQKQYEKEARNAIKILNAIMTKVPLMVYGLTLKQDRPITYDNFPNLIDDASWKEFMPKDATKERFKLFKKYIDIDMFELCNEELRQQIQAANKLTVKERIKRLTPLFLKFRNPDKETVLTPWRVVNMHLGDCIGGYNFYNENYSVVLDEPRFINKGKVTSDILKNTEAKVLEINSKTGLYPLYIAYSLFKERLSRPLTNKSERNVWKDTIEKNIYVICRTDMATEITKRTLVGDDLNIKVNVITINNMIEQLRTNPENVISKILNKSEWNIQEGGKMQFDAIVGNPPYNIIDGGAQASATPVYNLFVELSKNLKTEYISLIMPSRWMTGGKGLDKFRLEMINDRHLVKLYDYANSKECFEVVDIKGGVCYFLRDNNEERPCDIYAINVDGINHTQRFLYSGESIYIRDPRLLAIKDKVFVRKEKTLDTIVSARKPYGLEAETMVKASKYGLPDFSNTIIKNGYKIFGLDDKGNRTWKYIPKDYPIPKLNEGLNKYKVFIAEAYGCGAIGEVVSTPVLSTPVLSTPGELCTETFLQMGPFSAANEAQNLIKYIKTKFFRTLVGIQKQTQHTTQKAYRFVPLQDFTSNSDIDWSAPISEIDKQLYIKYKLSKEDIDFIEEKVKPME